MLCFSREMNSENALNKNISFPSGENELQGGQIFVYYFVPIAGFLIGLFNGFFSARSLKKRMLRGEIDWQKCRKARLRGIVSFVGIGTLLALIGYYGFATDTPLIKLIIGVEVNILLEAFMLLGFLLFGTCFLELD